VTSSIGAGSGEACRKINVDQSIEDFVHHNQGAAVMTTLFQCWPLEVAQHCSDATVGVVVASHVASCVSLNMSFFQLVPKSVTLNDLERRNGSYFAELGRFRGALLESD